MPTKPKPPLTAFRAYLTDEKRLSAASAASYVKHVRRALHAVKATYTGRPSAEDLATYDATLSVAGRDGFRAAWKHFVEFWSFTGADSLALAPARRLPRPLTGSRHE